MSNADRRVIALGNLAGELKTSLEAAARAAGLELLLTREPARAFIELERDGALAVLVDMATLGAEQFCKRARGTERLRSVPVIGMSRHPNELGFARVFAWGADDLVPLGARLPLEHRLLVLRDTTRPDTSGFGQAVVAEATTQRRALVGRVLAQAGYEVKFAVDRGAVELYASQSETRLVVISAALGDPRRIIEAAARAGALPTWIVTVEARSTQRLAASLAGLDRVAVTSTAGSPEDVLFLANELVFSKGARRREWRALYATPVAFRAAGGDADEYGFSYDASPSGLYVRSLLPCATDDVEVELRLPNRDERVRLSGKVMRRFAFGSGAIASAPPGFSVKLEGPEDALARWTDACAELIAAASSESMPPRPRSPSQPVLTSPGFGAKEVALAVPPATVSIESVVAPLPVALQAAIAEGSDVGELLSATLDEQTLAQVGTRPVTMDPETLGVREERPSEFAISAASVMSASIPAPLDPTISAPPVPIPSAPTPEPSLPGKEAAREALGKMGTMLLDPLPPPIPPATDAKAAFAGTVLLQPEAEPPPPPSARSTDWESDAKTDVRASQPSLERAPANPKTAAGDAPKPAPAPSPSPPAARVAPRPAAPSTPKTQDAAPVPAPKTPEPAPAAFAPTEPPPAPAPAPAAPAPAAPAPRAEEARPAPVPPARDPFATPSIKQTLPMGTPKQTVPAADAPKSAAPIPRAAGKKSPLPPAPAPSAGSRVLLFVAASAGAIAVGMGLAFVTRGPARGAPPIAAAPAERPMSSSSEVPQLSAQSTATATPPAVVGASAAPLAASAAAASGVPSAAPTAGTAPAQSAAAAAATAPVPAAPPPVPASTIDVSKLPRDRAALVVHSSARTHVFVHGTDYGATNEMLMTSCGIRFVRLGQALGDFVEPGQSYVIKCGKLTELSIEPSP